MIERRIGDGMCFGSLTLIKTRCCAPSAVNQKTVGPASTWLWLMWETGGGLAERRKTTPV
jgi:hypothetical protein